MKKTNAIAMGVLAVATACSLAGCADGQQGAEADSNTAQQVQASSVQQQNAASAAADATTLDGIIDSIEKDFKATEADIAAGLDDAKAKAGGSYADYAANSDALTNWIADTQAKTEALVARTNESAAKYYTLLAQQASTMDWGDVDDAMTAFYRAVYDDSFGDFYRAVYTDDYKDVYRTFYDGVMKEAYDVVSYAEASDAQSNLYREISDAQSDLYRSISDAQSDLYRTYSDVYGEFYDKNYDLSKVLGK